MNTLAYFREEGSWEAQVEAWLEADLEAIAALRAPTEDHDLTTSKRNEALLARVGIAARALQDRPDETPTQRAIRGAEAANHLVFKLLLIWAVIIAAMTLYGFTQ